MGRVKQMMHKVRKYDKISEPQIICVQLQLQLNMVLLVY